RFACSSLPHAWSRRSPRFLPTRVISSATYHIHSPSQLRVTSPAMLSSRPRVLVIVPTYNERDNLPAVIAAVHKHLPIADLLIVDDNSPDGTGALADQLAASDPQLQVLHRPGKMGLGTAYIAGFR